MREEIWKQLASRTFLVSSISSQRLRTKADRSIKIKIRRNSRFLAQFKVIDCKEETWERHDGGTKLFWTCLGSVCDLFLVSKGLLLGVF